MSYTYEYPRPALTVDCVVFGFTPSKGLEVLLIQRAHDPYAEHWALPGGFVDMDEDALCAASRELEEETGLRNCSLKQFYTFSTPDRDPRGRVVSIGFQTLVNSQDHVIKANSDAKAAQWFTIDNLPPLAFDHNRIVQKALVDLRLQFRFTPVGLEVLPSPFLRESLIELYETILSHPFKKLDLNPDKFITQVRNLDLIREWMDSSKDSHGDKKMFIFNTSVYHQLQSRFQEQQIPLGLNFETL